MSGANNLNLSVKFCIYVGPILYRSSQFPIVRLRFYLLVAHCESSPRNLGFCVWRPKIHIWKCWKLELRFRILSTLKFIPRLISRILVGITPVTHFSHMFGNLQMCEEGKHFGGTINCGANRENAIFTGNSGQPFI